MKILYASIMVLIFIVLNSSMNFSDIVPVFAHTITSSLPFTSSTDKIEYDVGETIKISGMVANEIMKPDQAVIIQILNPAGREYENSTVDLKSQSPYTDGSYNYGYKYEYDFKIIEGATSGYYQIMIYYDKSLQNSYTITYDKTHTNYNTYYIYNALLDNDTYPIRYKLSEGNEIHQIKINAQSKMINIVLNGVLNKTGQLIVEVPRTMIDSRFDNGTDKNFTVSAGVAGTAMVYTNNSKEIQKTAESRTLQFDISPYNTDYLISIDGTQSTNPDKTIQNNIMSPLKQFKSGIKAQDVKCKEGFKLIIKATDHSPACVKPDTAQILIERGWIKLV